MSNDLLQDMVGEFRINEKWAVGVGMFLSQSGESANSQVKTQTKHWTNKQKGLSVSLLFQRLDVNFGQFSSPDFNLPDYDLFAMSHQQAPWCLRFNAQKSVNVASQVCNEMKPSEQLASLRTQLEKIPNSSHVIKFVLSKWTNLYPLLKLFLCKALENGLGETSLFNMHSCVSLHCGIGSR